jgi:hypothetical protein
MAGTASGKGAIGAMLWVVALMVACAVCGNPVYADPADEPPPDPVEADGKPSWYDKEDWEELSVEEQKQAYGDRINKECAEAIRFNRLRYPRNRALHDWAATRLENAITAIGGPGAPGPVPRPPQTVPEGGPGDPAWDAWSAHIWAMKAWVEAFHNWYAGLTAQQKEDVGKLFDDMMRYWSRVSTNVDGIRDAKAARGEAEKALARHCDHYDG